MNPLLTVQKDQDEGYLDFALAGLESFGGKRHPRAAVEGNLALLERSDRTDYGRSASLHLAELPSGTKRARQLTTNISKRRKRAVKPLAMSPNIRREAGRIVLDKMKRSQTIEPKPAPAWRVAARWKLSDGTPWKAGGLRSVGRRSSVFSSFWNEAFAKVASLDASHMQVMSREEETDLRTPQWLKNLSSSVESNFGTINADDLVRQHHQPRTDHWAQIALWLLVHGRPQTFDFLLATHIAPFPPIDWVEDCLEYLGAHYARQPFPEPGKVAQLVHAFSVLADRQGKERMAVRSTFVWDLLQHCSDEQVEQIFRTIKLHEVIVSPHTFHHISARFADKGHLEKGIDALLEARIAGASLNYLPFRKNCAKLLRQSIQHTDGLRMCLRLIDNLVGLGVRLDIRLCNIIMLNAVESGDIGTAFSVYRSLTSQGLRPNSVTFNVLLKGCKLDIDNADALKEVIQSAVQNTDARQNPISAIEILHCLLLHHSKHAPNQAFSILSDAYAQFFDLTPLRALKLPTPSIPVIRIGLQKPPLPPPPHAIQFMLIAYLQDPTTTRDTAYTLYTNWRHLVHQGMSPLASLASQTYVANVFLGHFIKTKETLLHAAQVVRDMQRRLPATAGVIQAAPDAQTWSLFLHGFSRHGQTKLGEQVLAHMRKNNIEPTHITWNMLVAGYAKAQDLDGTLDALRRLEESGVAFDDWVKGGLRGFRNQHLLKQELEKVAFQKRMDFTDELKEGLMGRLAAASETGSEAPGIETAIPRGKDEQISAPLQEEASTAAEDTGDSAVSSTVDIERPAPSGL